MSIATRTANKSSDGPPWMAYNPDGTEHCGGVPDRLLKHPEMRRRGIILTDALKPGVVFRAEQDDEPSFVVKVFDLNTEELHIYERLLAGIHSPCNHTVPSEIYRDGHPLLIMPCLNNLTTMQISEGRTPDRLLDIFYQLVEGVEYLHSLHIAHLDICPGNVVAALPYDARFHPGVISLRVYVIDFNTSKQLALGPGAQPAITLPPTQVPPPEGLKRFDPYSWDVYCLGQLFQSVIKTYSRGGKRAPWAAQCYARWLIGEERGCDMVCRCRPTARTARRVLSVIRLLAPLIALCERFYLTLWGRSAVST
ncbi:hypothetical protein C8Q73DRAFT_285685 [Cubamyces lactineus]|nr:hypothetical protein C8Q73DRAFT_285685 [Cubamyces lactineus]